MNFRHQKKRGTLYSLFADHEKKTHESEMKKPFVQIKIQLATASDN